MIERAKAWKFIHKWLEAWNTCDADLMMRYPTFLVLCCIFLCSPFVPAHAVDMDRCHQLEECLIQGWRLDRCTVDYLMKKFSALIEGTDFLVDDFINKSKNLHINFSVARDVQPLQAEDAILCAPKHHLIIFENLYIRILWGSTASGEREPFHVHPWRSLLLVLKPGVYQIEYADGRCEQWNGQIGVYELPANERYSCTNIGEAADEMIRFEVKE
jgi:hypothetical protein